MDADSTGNFLRAQADSWGNSGSNGGDVTLTMSKQKASGNIVIDSISTLDMTMKNNSSYKGTINGSNEAKSIALTLDKSSKITLTGHSRDLHAHAGHINSYPQFFTPVERAWAVWALCKMSFASMMDGTFGYDFGGMMPKKLRNAKDEFTEQLCQRLERVTIENRNALDVIACYDAPDAFHFVDPPYVNSDCGHYEDTFNEQNMEQLLQLLETVKGKFMLTMFPFDMIDRYAQKNGWIIHRVERTISASKSSRRRQEEWMVCNYEERAQASLFEGGYLGE